MSLYRRLFPEDNQTRLWVLIDPDKAPHNELVKVAMNAEEGGASAILIGGSLLFNDAFDQVVQSIKRDVNIPVILFPGSSRQISRYADGILFMSLLSGRNPQFLIGEQVQAAPIISSIGLPAISTAYLLIESGTTTSAEFVSNTRPIPRTKPLIAAAHAQAAELLGMKVIYLEAGSGAKMPVPPEMVKVVSQSVSIPVIVGGGIINSEGAKTAAKNGARVIVVGTAIEEKGSKVISEIAAALFTTVVNG
ncbi:MAG: geranylgeranylglyceryl/heptaprenylglyceryl phosphate synthase [Candidatus Hatepunaea meridiana]|nr:geranylgeranylglyceryl/heptaprenylglyceryl phosphate synthase [Candidatus Hatepunaea meridiana]